MVFSSLLFLLIFLPSLLLLYFVNRSIKWRNAVLLVFSLLFYAWGEPKWIVCLLGSTLVNYCCALALTGAKTSGHKKLIVTTGVIASLAALFYFKYAAFFIDSISNAFRLNWNPVRVPLPIGISFYTFQILTYTIDVYRGKVEPQKNFFRLLLYVSCFPQLIAGPIVKYSDIADSLNERTTTLQGFSEGMGRFSVGLAKKVLLANICGKSVETLMTSGTYSVLGGWLGALLYAFQLYFDFSAYSDMAIGLGRVLGFTYLENFNYPYISESVSEFWRRWHISLGTFFREYVYIPLGGNRNGNWRTIRNLLIVWGLTGLWHGASWNFVLWGLYYGIWIVLERFVLNRLVQKIPKLLRRIITFFIVLIGWVLFYHESLGEVMIHLGAMFGAGATGMIDQTVRTVLSDFTVFPLIAAVCCLPIVPAMNKIIEKSPFLSNTAKWLIPVGQTAILILTMIFLVGQSYNPFIYFRF